MPELKITVAGRPFEVACQEGQEPFLEAAAARLDREASQLSKQVGRMPEAKMLLMTSLMLADSNLGHEQDLAELKREIDGLKHHIQDLENRPAPDPEKVEIPVIPRDVLESMGEVAARLEALAADLSQDPNPELALAETEENSEGLS